MSRVSISQFWMAEIIFQVQMLIAIYVSFKKKTVIHHKTILTGKKYYRFYDEILHWQPNMHGQPLYDKV